MSEEQKPAKAQDDPKASASESDSPDSGDQDSASSETASVEGESASDEADAAEDHPATAKESKSTDSTASADRRAAPKPRKKKKKKKSAAASAQDIRDRNQRVRAEAAARRRAERERSRQIGGLDASELVDDALARGTHAATTWLKRHFNVVQWVLVIGIGGGVAWMIYSWRADRRAEKGSDALMKAVNAQDARVGDEPDETDPRTGIEDLREHFATDKARLEAAASEYRKAMDTGGNSGPAQLAKVGLAATLYDQKKFDEALKTYESLRNSELAKSDPDVHGRVLEGIGMCLEAKGDPDRALKAYRELQNADLPGFTALAMYHQARVLHAKGDDEKAKKLVEDAIKKAQSAHAPMAPATYVEIALHELLTTIDPVAAASMMPGGMNMSQIERLKAQLSKIQGMGDPKQLERLMKEIQSKKGKGTPGKTKAPAPPASSTP